jgi:DNA integrity scanning protein DisA with diadenylate cyclase activity
METLMDVSLESTKACLEKIEASQGKVEIKVEACLEEMQGETIGALKERCGN